MGEALRVQRCSLFPVHSLCFLLPVGDRSARLSVSSSSAVSSTCCLAAAAILDPHHPEWQASINPSLCFHGHSVLSQ